MLKQKQINEVINDSKCKEVSPYTLVKRLIFYKKQHERHFECCKRCKNRVSVQYKDAKKIQCHVIGIINDSCADIKDDYVCNKFDR